MRPVTDADPAPYPSARSQPQGGATMASPVVPPSPQLDRLLSDLRDARRALSVERGPRRQRAEETLAQANLLAALNAYSAALTAAGHPLPYKLRDELHLRRQLAATGGRPDPAACDSTRRTQTKRPVEDRRQA